MKKTFKYSNFILLQFFTLFSEYFLSVSAIYILIAIVLITRNSYGLMIQKALGECISLMLFMACYLIFNDDVLIYSNTIVFNSSYVNDYVTYISKFTICFFSAAYFLIIADFLKEQKLTSFEYLLITLFAVIGFMLLCNSYDFLTAYLAIELSSLSLYLLASFKKTSNYSVESGLKYFVSGTVSSALFLLGVSFIYVFTGSINFSDLYFMHGSNCWLGDLFPQDPTSFEYPITSFISFCLMAAFYGNLFEDTFMIPLEYDPFFDNLDLSFYELGLTLVIFSLFIKLAAAPFHLWSLDVYEGSPTTSSFFFAVLSKFSIFVLMFRFLFHNAHEVFHYNWPFYFFLVGFCSVFIGSFGGLRQRKIKTLLAYSSIMNIGYALLAFGTNSLCGIQAICIHLIIYMLSGLCVWFILLLLRLKTKKISNKYNKELCDLALLSKSNPALAFALSLTMFSIAGIPPLVGFLAKMSIFFALITSQIYIFVVTSAILSVLSTFYYIRVVKILYFENLLVGKLYCPINSSKTLILSVLIFFLIFLFADPCVLYLISYKLLPVRYLGRPLPDSAFSKYFYAFIAFSRL